jgi:hypothetical protein
MIFGFPAEIRTAYLPNTRYTHCGLGLLTRCCSMTPGLSFGTEISFHSLNLLYFEIYSSIEATSEPG